MAERMATLRVRGVGSRKERRTPSPWPRGWRSSKFGSAGFIAAELAGEFVHGAVEGVTVDGGGGCVEPDPGRVGEAGDDRLSRRVVWMRES